MNYNFVENLSDEQILELYDDLVENNDNLFAYTYYCCLHCVCENASSTDRYTVWVHTYINKPEGYVGYYSNYCNTRCVNKGSRAAYTVVNWCTEDAAQGNDID